jgi:glucose-1-phosphate thymidylyltransferase
MASYIGVIPAAGIASRMAPLDYSKELLPITYVADGGGALRPMPVIEASFRQLRTAGIDRCAVVISDRKPELMRYLGHGGGIGLDIAFLNQSRPDGLAAAVALSVPWTGDANACLLLPDTIVRPDDALRQVCAAFESHDADLVLGVLPTQRPQELGPVRFDADMRVLEVQDKPAATDLDNSWALAVWSPRFSQLLKAAVAQAPPDAGPALGSVFHRAIGAGLKVRAVWFAQGQFFDLGTPRGLAEALPLIRDGI